MGRKMKMSAGHSIPFVILILSSGVLLGNPDRVGKVIELDESRGEVAVAFPLGTDIQVGSILEIKPAAGTETQFLNRLHSCKVQVEKTYRTDPELLSKTKEVVVAGSRLCTKKNESVKIGMRVIPIDESDLISVLKANRMRDRASEENPSDAREEIFPKNEISASVNYGGFSFAGATTSIKLGGEYSYLVSPGVQIGLVGQYQTLAAGSINIGAGTALAALTLNFPMTDDIREAAALEFGLGVTTANVTIGTSSSSTAPFTFGVSLSKRFRLHENFLYRPGFGITRAGGPETVFSIVPLNFSFMY